MLEIRQRLQPYCLNNSVIFIWGILNKTEILEYAEIIHLVKYFPCKYDGLSLNSKICMESKSGSVHL